MRLVDNVLNLRLMNLREIDAAKDSVATPRLGDLKGAAQTIQGSEPIGVPSVVLGAGVESDAKHGKSPADLVGSTRWMSNCRICEQIGA